MALISSNFNIAACDGYDYEKQRKNLNSVFEQMNNTMNSVNSRKLDEEKKEKERLEKEKKEKEEAERKKKEEEEKKNKKKEDKKEEKKKEDTEMEIEK